MTLYRVVVARAMCILVVFGLALSGCDIFESGDYKEPIPFDAAIWRNGERPVTSSDEAPRLRMADGLVRDKVLLGKTKREIEELLGSPTQTSKFADYGLVYWLGPERGSMSIDSEWLVVSFNADGVATRAKIVRD
jgi:hypothetical protein